MNCYMRDFAPKPRRRVTFAGRLWFTYIGLCWLVTVTAYTWCAVTEFYR